MGSPQEKNYKIEYLESKKERLDIFLQSKFPEFSRSYLQKLIKNSFVLVNGVNKKQNYLLKEKDLIEIKFPEIVSEEELQAWDHPIDIIYQDNSIIVINKPSGLVVHPGAGNKTHTLVNALINKFPEIKNIGHPMRPGIVHRLDKETQGLMIIAKNLASYYSLIQQFADRKVKKKYYAIVWGKPKNITGVLSIPIGRSQKDRKKVSPFTKKAKEAVTEYKVIKSNEYFSLLDINIRTGRTHQIRVHMSYSGFPIVGDKKYSGANWNRIKEKVLREKLKKLNLFALQAYYIAFNHPEKNEWLEFSLPLSEQLAFILQ